MNHSCYSHHRYHNDDGGKRISSRLGGKPLARSPISEGLEEIPPDSGSFWARVSPCSAAYLYGWGPHPFLQSWIGSPPLQFFDSIFHHICDLNRECAFVFCRGYGFVKFTDELEQKRALTECQGAVGLGSKPVRLSVAIPKA